MTDQHDNNTMLRVWVFIVVCFTAVTVAYLVRDDVAPKDSIKDGRFKRQATETNPTTDDNNNEPHPGPRRRFHKFQCCENMKMIFNWDIMKSCMSSGGHKYGPPGPPPGGPPPPRGPPPRGGPPPPGGPYSPPPPPEGDIDGSDNVSSPDYGTEGLDAEPTAGSPETPSSAPTENYEHRGKGRGRGGKGRGRFRNYFACAMECGFGKINAIKDGVIDQEALEDHVEKIFSSDDEWKNVTLDALKNCSSIDTTTIDQDQKCKSGAAETLKCVYKQMFKNCPESSWQNTEECNACRDSKDKCWFKKGGKWKGHVKKE